MKVSKVFYSYLNGKLNDIRINRFDSTEEVHEGYLISKAEHKKYLLMKDNLKLAYETLESFVEDNKCDIKLLKDNEKFAYYDVTLVQMGKAVLYKIKDSIG